MESKQPVIIKTYEGDENSSRRAFENDAQIMQEKGYYPISQNYTPGSWGCGSFLIATLLLLILIGIIVFIYMLIVKPDGTLSVTYELREKEKKCPMCAENVKYEAKICKHCGYELPPNPIIKEEIISQKIETSESFIKSTDFKNNKYSLIALIIVVLVIISYIILFFNGFVNNN